MIIDSSALAAMLFGEPERRPLIEAADARLVSVANRAAISIVVEARYGAEGAGDLGRFIERAAVERVAVDFDQARAAQDAGIRFGKGLHQSGSA